MFHFYLSLVAPWSYTSQPPELWGIIVCCLSHPGYGILLQQPEQHRLARSVYFINLIDVHPYCFSSYLTSIGCRRTLTLLASMYNMDGGWSRAAFWESPPCFYYAPRGKNAVHIIWAYQLALVFVITRLVINSSPGLINWICHFSGFVTLSKLFDLPVSVF